ncbi:MAG: 1-acyl-sn-glycerol-3-phosphate acyltransferase [Rubrobacter sp.]
MSRRAAWVVLWFAFAGWVAGRFLPGARWLLRRRAERVAEAARRRGVKLPALESSGRRGMIRRLLQDPEVTVAAEAYARENGISTARAMGRVERYAREIVPAFNAFLYFRGGIPLAGRIVRALYDVRLTSDEGLIALERVPDRGTSVVFVMNHRSNLDYVILAHLTADRTSLTFAAGEWARSIGPLVHAMGAFFVRRGSGNELYRKVLERFSQMAVELGLTQVVFPEGGLSRDGRMRAPKVGLFDYVLRHFDAVRTEILYVPVAVNYDWVLEDHALLQPGGPEAGLRGRGGLAASTTVSFVRNLLRAWRGGDYHLGEAALAFGTPVSVREYQVSRGMVFRDLDREARIEEVKVLAGYLMHTIREAVPDTALPLVARVLAEVGDGPIRKEDLFSRAEGLALGGGHLDFDAALRTLEVRRLVQEERGGYRSTPGAEKLLGYYASSVYR